MQLMSKLIYAGLACAAASVAMGFTLKKKISEEISKSEVYKCALNALRQNDGAKYLLGEPIEESTATFNSLGSDEKSNVKVLVKGPKSSGILYFSFKRDEQDSNMGLKSIQLQVGKDDTKRLVINLPKEKSVES